MKRTLTLPLSTARHLKVGDKLNVVEPDSRWWSKLLWKFLRKSGHPERTRVMRIVSFMSKTELILESTYD